MIDAIHSNAWPDKLLIEEEANNFTLELGHSNPHPQSAPDSRKGTRPRLYCLLGRLQGWLGTGHAL